MSISTTSIKNTYTGNGSTDAFAYTFKITDQTHLKVYIRTIATGAEALKTLTTHYTVSGVGADSGGTVTFTTGNIPTDAQQIVIRRLTPQTQATDYVENDPFPANTHETALDKLTAISQELQEESDRSFKVSKTNTITTTEFVDSATDRASKLLGFDSSGDLQVTTGRVSSVTVSAVAAGGSPTVSYSDTTGALALGVVTGNTGATGAGVDVLTTRGDLLKQGASAAERLAIGSANRVLTTDGTDPAWSTVTNAMLAGSIDLTSKVTGALPLANGGTGATSLAAANIVATNAQQTFTKAQVPSTYTAALSATSGVLDYDTYQNFIITLAAGSNTLAAPTTEASQVGQCGVIIFIQPGSGSAATLSLHADHETAGAAGITLSSANNDYDVVAYVIKADNSILLSQAQLNFG